MKSNFDLSFDLVMNIEGNRILTDDRLDPEFVEAKLYITAYQQCRRLFIE